MPAKAPPARAEVVLKFTEFPVPTPVPGDGKRVELRLSAPPFTFVAKLRNKSINKAKKAMEEYEEWTGALTGKLGSTVEGKLVCHLEEAGLQIFERTAPKTKPSEAEAVPEASDETKSVPEVAPAPET